MRVARNFFIISLNIWFYSRVSAVMDNSKHRTSNMDDFKYCMQKSQNPKLHECVGQTAISFLQRFEEQNNYNLAEDIVSTKDDTKSGRSIVNMLDTDPVDFRGILENAGAVFSQRNFEWHMDRLYPGLMLKIGPTADTNSVAEFVIDPARNERQLNYQEPSTARILTKQYLLPFLLGLKFNLVALVPLLFAGIILLLKKSLFLAKLAVYVSSFLGIGGAAGLLGGLGGLSGIGGGLGSSLGHGSLFGIGSGLNDIRGHGQNFDVSSTAAHSGYFPGKTTVYNQHFESGDDELHQTLPYKRSERKLRFEKPREFADIPAVADHFFDYEKQKTIQNRAGKLKMNKGELGLDAFHEDTAKTIFKPSEQISFL